ncbi:MAG: hypothetical protein FJ100_09640 [Deltaproteobacteria bacterium]|nr:hypothetical protein [Deltaproteobacteria bacterium]
MAYPNGQDRYDGDDDATQMRGAADDDGGDVPPDLPDGPPDLPAGPPPMPLHRAAADPRPTTLGSHAGVATQRPGTGTQFQIAAMDDVPDLPGQPPIEIARSPAPTRQRPTLLPAAFDQPPKLPGAAKTAEPGLLRPVRPAAEPPKGPVHLQKESSDVIQVYDTQNQGEVKRSTLHPMAPPRTHAPGAGLQAVQPVPPQPASRAPIRKVPTAPPNQPSGPRPAQHIAMAAAPGPLPLNADVMVGLIAAHRGRMTTLDLFARGLEICAGVLGSLSIGFLIATLVALLVGRGYTLLGAATALVVEVAGVSLAVAMLAQAAALRHQASSAAQTAALLEALSGGGR